MVQLGQFFYNEGDDSEKAFYWLQHAAGKGDVTAQARVEHFAVFEKLFSR